LGIPLSKMILEGPAEELDLTVNAQPAILATSYAFLEAMREEALEAASRSRRRRSPATRPASTPPPSPPTRSTYADALRLVRERGRIMQERGIEGGMGAVIGLSDEQVEEVLDAASEHGEIAVANQNAAGQIVLSGVIPALVFALEMSKTVGARKAVRLT
jgi:[acyl-carrier-protein] S-malonyltransferase